MDLTKKFSNIDEYHDSFPHETKALLDKLRTAIKEAAPDAQEVISYNMPAFKQNGILVYYAAHKEHIGFYPTSSPIKAFTDELAGFKTSKGAVQFPKSQGIPVELVQKMVHFKLMENKNKTRKKSS